MAVQPCGSCQVETVASRQHLFFRADLQSEAALAIVANEKWNIEPTRGSLDRLSQASKLLDQ